MSLTGTDDTEASCSLRACAAGNDSCSEIHGTPLGCDGSCFLCFRALRDVVGRSGTPDVPVGSCGASGARKAGTRPSFVPPPGAANCAFEFMARSAGCRCCLAEEDGRAWLLR